MDRFVVPRRTQELEERLKAVASRPQRKVRYFLYLMHSFNFLRRLDVANHRLGGCGLLMPKQGVWRTSLALGASIQG